MNRIINTGLCALLVGTTSFALGDSNKLGNPKRSKTTSATSQNTFLGPGGNYSINCNPRDYGFTLEEHISKFDNSYADNYRSLTGIIDVISVETEMDLQESYVLSVSLGAKEYCDNLLKNLQPGLGIRIVGKGEPKKLTIDGNPALQGGAELWITLNESEMLKGNYLGKFDYLLTISQADGFNHLFILFNSKDGTEKETQVNELYDCFLRSFHALKP